MLRDFVLCCLSYAILACPGVEEHALMHSSGANNRDGTPPDRRLTGCSVFYPSKTTCATCIVDSYAGVEAWCFSGGGFCTDIGGPAYCSCEGPYATASSGCCSAGRYATTSGTCAACAAGKYSSTSASTSCANCAAGKYSGSGASSCPNCAAGKYSSSGSSSCTNCAAGKYSGSGSISCTNCAAGRYADGGDSSCTICSAGRYAGAGSATCTSCEAGKYSITTGATSSSSCQACTVCAAGRTQSAACGVDRDTVCTVCNPGLWSLGGTFPCVATPSATALPTVTATSTVSSSILPTVSASVSSTPSQKFPSATGDASVTFCATNCANATPATQTTTRAPLMTEAASVSTTVVASATVFMTASASWTLSASRSRSTTSTPSYTLDEPLEAPTSSLTSPAATFPASTRAAHTTTSQLVSASASATAPVLAWSSDMLAVGCAHTCIVVQHANEGSAAVYCWGDNRQGQCGYDPKAHPHVASLVDSRLLGPVSAAQGGFATIQAGCLHTCLQHRNDSTVCWGSRASFAAGAAADQWSFSSEWCGSVKPLVVGDYYTCINGQCVGAASSLRADLCPQHFNQ